MNEWACWNLSHISDLFTHSAQQVESGGVSMGTGKCVEATKEFVDLVHQRKP